jgi:glycosyltransferase involved in cell wall biosynthesis
MKAKTVKTIIVTTHDSLGPVKGGGALRTLAVIRELEKRLFRIMVIAPFDQQIMEQNSTLYLSVPQPRKERSQILSALKFNFRLFRRMVPILGQADVLFAHNTIACIWVPFFKIFFRHFSFVLDITDIHAEYLPIGKRNLIEIAATPFLLWYEYVIIKSADRITVATQAMRKHLITKGIDQDKITVVYDSAHKQDLPQDKEEHAGRNVIHLGAIDRQHNVEILIAAIPAVLRKFPQTKFFLVGGGREKENIQKLVKELGVEERCVFTGSLPCVQAREYLKQAAIGVITRKDVLANRIITTLKIFEYWASNTTVISSASEGIKEIATGGSDILWFRSGDAGDLAEKINLLLGDQAYRDKLASGGLAKVSAFDTATAAEKIVDFSIAF